MWEELHSILHLFILYIFQKIYLFDNFYYNYHLDVGGVAGREHTTEDGNESGTSNFFDQIMTRYNKI